MYHFIHYYIPELKIRKIIGEFNNCIFQDIKYFSHDKSFFIKEIHVKASFNLLRNRGIFIDKILFTGCDLYIKNTFFTILKDKLLYLNVRLIYFLKFPIILKDIKFDNFSFSTKKMLFFIDHFSGVYIWTGKELKCLYSQVNNIFIKQKEIIKVYKNKVEALNLKKDIIPNIYFEDILKHLEIWRVNIPINIDLQYLHSKNIYFFGKHNFYLSNFFVNFKISDNEVVVKELYFSIYRIKFIIFGTLNFNKNFLTRFLIYCSNLEKNCNRESLIISINGFLLNQLKMNFNFFGYLNTKIYIKLELEKFNSFLHTELVIPCLDLVINKKKYILFKEIKSKIVGNLSNFNFFIHGMVNINYFFPIQLYFSGVRNNSTLYIKNIRCNLFEEEIIFKNLLNLLHRKKFSFPMVSYKNSNIFYIQFVIKKIMEEFLKLKKNNHLILDIIVFFKHNPIKVINSKLHFSLFQILKKWTISFFNYFSFKKNSKIINNCIREETPINIVVKLRLLNNSLFSFFERIYGNVDILYFKKKYEFSMHFIGKDLIWNGFKMSNFKLLVILKHGIYDFFETQLFIQNLFVFNINISSFLLKLSNNKHGYNLILDVLKNNYCLDINLSGKSNIFITNQIKVINKVNFLTPLYYFHFNNIFVIFKSKKTINYIKELFFSTNYKSKRSITYFIQSIVDNILNNNNKNFKNIFKNWKNLFFSNKLFSCAATFQLNYVFNCKTLTLKWNFQENMCFKTNQIFKGVMNFNKVERKFFINGNIILKSFSIKLLNFYSTDMQNFFGVLNGNLVFKGIMENFQLHGNLSISNIYIKNLFYVKKIYFNSLKLTVNHNNFIFSSIVKMESFLKLMFKLKFLYLNVFSLK
ncbi:MAG: hypothetical protein U0T64_00405 [Buchnera aphidicola (Nurudea yanoniella)]